MHIIVSGKKREVADGLTVAQLLNGEKNDLPRYVSVVTKREVLIDPNNQNQTLHDGDTVEFIYRGES